MSCDCRDSGSALTKLRIATKLYRLWSRYDWNLVPMILRLYHLENEKIGGLAYFYDDDLEAALNRELGRE